MSGAGRDVGRTNLVAVSVGHLAIDIFNSMGPVLVAHLRLVMGLSGAQVGLAVGAYQLLSGATQPLFGWLVDRRGSGRLGPLSVAWVIALVGVAAVAAPRIGYVPFLLLFSCAALGSGAFHPQGTMHAGVAVPGKASTTTAIFFFCGQIGLSLGPFLAGGLIDGVGLAGIAWLGLLFLPVPLWMARRMSRSLPSEPVVVSTPPAASPPRSGPRWPVAVLTAIFACRAWIFIGTAAFLPLIFQADGASATRQGLLTGAFWFGGGLSGILAGVLADRLGKRVVAAACTAAGALLLPLLPDVAGGTALLVVMLTGALLGAPHSVLMVLAQELLPVRRALAAGYALGFLFSMGAVASWGIGVLADRNDLDTVIRWGVAPGLAAALLLLLLPATSPPTAPGLAESP